jgi:ABC-type sugar transport system ATPase subunit
MTLADRIVVMRAGEVEQVGSPMEIYSNPVSHFVADFFGSPSMNLVAGEIVHGGRFRSKCFDVALPDRFAAAGPGPVTLGIRPEHVGVGMNGTTTKTASLPVKLVEPLGKDTLLYFDAGSERSFVAVSEGLDMAEVQIGAPLTLSFDPQKLHLFDTGGRRIQHA